ncbi:hypothetical protein Bca4012_020232 [Brassica carinata]
MDEHSYICLPEHASSFTRRELVQETYTKDDINEMFTGLLGERKWEKLSMEKSLEVATDKLRSEMNGCSMQTKDYSRRFNVLSWNLKIFATHRTIARKDQNRSTE